MRWLMILALFSLLVCAGCSKPMEPGAVQIGQTKDEVRVKFGEPESTTELIKRDEHIFGAIESFWSMVEDGAKVEIWYYPVSNGTLELYFVDDSNIVQGTGFAPAGAVY